MSQGARQTLRVFLLLVVPCIAIVIGTLIYLKGGRFVETDNAFVKAQTLRVSADIAGVIKTVYVSENELVATGQRLFRLDDAEHRIAMARALAQLDQVRTDLNAMRAEYREKQAEIRLANTQLRFARRVMKRQADLVKNNFASASRFDDAEHDVRVAGQQIATLKQNLISISERLGGAVDTSPESHPLYKAARAELQQTKLQMRRAEVRASLPGIVSKLPKPGQYLAVGHQAMTLVSNTDLWIEANFTETDLTRMVPGQQTTVHIDAYPDEQWEGVVESLSPATGAEFSIIPAQNATGNWVKIPQRVAVRIRLTIEAGQPALRSGLSAIVEIDTQHQRTLFGYAL